MADNVFFSFALCSTLRTVFIHLIQLSAFKGGLRVAVAMFKVGHGVALSAVVQSQRVTLPEVNS